MIHESQNIDVIFYSVMMLLMGEMIRIALSYSQLSTNKLSSPFTTRAAQTLWRQFLDKPVMLDDDLAWRPWKNWILYGANFLWHGTFHDAVKEFNIVKYFGLKHIKQIVEGSSPNVGPKSVHGLCTPLSIRESKVSQLRNLVASILETSGCRKKSKAS